jgi:hypothetical protein
MAKVRVSTTVDEALLEQARAVHGATTDASLLEAALTALLDSHRRAEVDAAYDRAYSPDGEARPDAEPDAWGDLAEWRERASTS